MIPAPTTEDLWQARTGLLSAVSALVRVARTFDPAGVERDAVRRAIGDCGNALIRIYPTAVVEAAQEHARRTLELLPSPDASVKLSGETVELYAAQLAKYFLAHGEEEPGA